MWPFSRKIEDVLNASKTIRVMGVKFKIKKIDVSNFLDGSKVMLQMYDIYKIKSDAVSNEDSLKNLGKIKEHFRDVFLSSVLEPKLKRKSDDKDGLFVDHLFTDWSLANELYSAIIEYTYGKKK